MIQARKSSPALRMGSFSVLATDDQTGTLAFARSHEGQTVVVAINTGAEPAEIDIPVEGFGFAEDQILRGLLDDRQSQVKEGRLRLRLEAVDGVYLA